MTSVLSHSLKYASLYSKKAFGIFTLTLLLFTSFLLLNQNAEAQQLVCPMLGIQQITDETSGDSEDSSINADGTRIAFQSDADITGGNPDGNIEIYLFDTTTGIFTQITDNTAGDSGAPSINADGTRIAFRSDANLGGGNPEGNFEIFLFDTTTGIFTQITHEPVEFESRGASINADGTRIAFRSDANLSGGNPDGNFEIYLFDTTTGITTQITFETAGVSRGPSINADGTRIAFRSDADINDGNPDGNFEIFIFDMTSGIFTQITDETTGDSRTTSIDADGTRIAFRSDADINGGNPDGNQEIYLAICFDLDDRVIPTLSQWGLIAMAGILGIVGFMVMRRRKVAA